MPVHNDMVVFPRVVRPALVMYETWQEFAERVGAAKYGATSLTASYMVVLGDHVGTHIDSLRHFARPPAGRGGDSARLLLRRRRRASTSGICRSAPGSRWRT